MEDPKNVVRVKVSELTGMCRIIAEAKLKHSTEYRCIRDGVPTIVTRG